VAVHSFAVNQPAIIRRTDSRSFMIWQSGTRSTTIPVVSDKFGRIGAAWCLGNEKALPMTFLLDAKGTLSAIVTAEGDDLVEVLLGRCGAVKGR